ncbi:MAG: GNAT family N-acetyltransferase [Candidatus Cloacimonetes bacterium]|nr:GNAT family N-acetyltransferase [Candidatus Cloacimonadota bacterium]
MRSAEDALTIRPLETPDDLRACVRLQEETWGPGFSEKVPYAVLWFTRRIGGVLIGAFDGDELVGYVFGVTGWRDRRPVHWSDMLAVRRDIRDRGIGLQLKRAQRAALLEAGVTLAQWTFEPLESRNAYLNLVRLGGVARTYERDVYGYSDSPLHGVIGTDRLIIDWHLDSPRVEGRLAGARATPPDAASLPAVNMVEIRDGIPVCTAVDIDRTDDAVALLIPADIARVRDRDADVARGWRACTRSAFEAYLARGYVVTELIRRDEQVSAYVLQRNDPT